ncbi:hypothetical protein BDM02DRAFT_1825827 [Thelephora ganbajun]|uniref:Uncharacterized protein n=1 Tax=Thelephora ganbajun TaxID=370292 RepID=A0ACB6ZIN0_THEGA|nr:hypothetical protein BDM02DRAFT_1825827 [Thelephora ganbajun]
MPLLPSRGDTPVARSGIKVELIPFAVTVTTACGWTRGPKNTRDFGQICNTNRARAIRGRTQFAPNIHPMYSLLKTDPILRLLCRTKNPDAAFNIRVLSAHNECLAIPGNGSNAPLEILRSLSDWIALLESRGIASSYFWMSPPWSSEYSFNSTSLSTLEQVLTIPLPLMVSPGPLL